MCDSSQGDLCPWLLAELLLRAAGMDMTDEAMEPVAAKNPSGGPDSSNVVDRLRSR
jgi:hypothetical protein